MKVLIVGDYHHKNKQGLERLLKYKGIEITYNVADIESCSLIYSPSNAINTEKYSNKKFIFGPHFSVFPTNKLVEINNVRNNGIYIQPSEWVTKFWREMNAENVISLRSFCFPVDTDKFKPLNDRNDCKKAFIYFKRRKPEELRLIEDVLKSRGFEYKIFDYMKTYEEEEYLKYLQGSKFGIILDAHESQGFAIEEALSCDVPLLVWNVRSMNQEYGYNYPDIPATSIPYWDDRCGEYFYEGDEVNKRLTELLNKLDEYKPREYVLENLSVEKCANNFIKLVDEIKL
tara:strand:- start:294 stop:1154 length:861 start_codon:yes stop_codon:yes gene_type:complete